MPKETFLNLPEEKIQRIINSAIHVFSKSHYKRVTVDHIVNESGIPKGSFYQYFMNKDDLYTYIFSQIGNQKKIALEEVTKQVEEISFKEYIIKALEAADKFETTDSRIFNLKNKFISECPQEIRKLVLKNEIPKSYRILEEAILLYIKKGELRKDLDVKNAAYIITSCTAGIENYEFYEGQKINDVIIQILDTLLVGFLMSKKECTRL